MLFRRGRTLENKGLSKIGKIFYSCVNVFLLLLFSLIVYFTISFKAHTNIAGVRDWGLFGEKQYVLLSLVIILLYYSVLYAFSKTRLLAWNRKKEVVIVVLFLALCLFSAYYFANEGVSEIPAVIKAAKFFSSCETIDDAFMEFLSQYRYLSPIIVWAAVCYKVGGKIFASVVVSAGMTLGLFVSLQVIKRLKGNNTSLWICTGLFFISIPIYLSCNIFYNFSLVFWVPITEIYLYLLYSDECDKSRKNLYFILMIIIGIFGISIFSIVAVPLIAISFGLIFSRKKEVIMLALLILLGTSIFSNITGKYVMNKIFDTDELQKMVYENEFPMTLSTMYVGLHDKTMGFVSMFDFWYIRSFKSYKEKQQGLRPQIIDRLDKAVRNPGFILTKSSINFCQGSYYSELVSEEGLLKEREIIRYFSKNYPEVVYYLSFFCAMNIFLILLMLTSIVMRITDFNTLRLSILGAWMVTMISETDSRHVFAFLPLFIVMGALTFSGVAEKCLSGMKNKKQEDTR